MHRLLGVFLCLAVLATVAGCGGAGGTAAAFGSDGRLRVASSFYPLYEFAEAVGGDRIDLVNLVPAGTEPHDWEPTAAHIRALNAAQVFLYNGAGFEHWVDKAVQSLDNDDLLVVEASRGFQLLEAHEGEADHEEEAGHEHGEFDPHLWLDPNGAIHIVERIRDAFSEADPGNVDYYRTNAEAYVAELKALDQEFAQGLAQCELRTFFTTHNAFGYLAHRYDLTQQPLMGLAPDAEPTPKALKQVVDQARDANVRYIFFETLVSDKVAKVVAGEIGAETLVLNPFEGLAEVQVQAGQNYFTVMRQNLANLKRAMECE